MRCVQRPSLTVVSDALNGGGWGVRTVRVHQSLLVGSRSSAYTRVVPDLAADLAVALDDSVRVDFGPADRVAVDGTGGSLDLAAFSVDVMSLTLVDPPSSPMEVARRVGLTAAGGFLHGARWAVLAPHDHEWRVGILTAGEADPAQSRIDVGRLSDRDVERWAKILDGRAVRVVAFIEATPGFAGIDVRFRPGLVEDDSESAPGRSAPTRSELDLASPPAAPAQWYVDPADPAQHRYWDGATWTGHTNRR